MNHWCYLLQKLSTDSRPREVGYWIKKHIRKKQDPVIVTPTEYGPRYVAWWKSMQPSWRVLSDGAYSKAIPADETWSNLRKGGSAGLYIIVMALSWWVRAVGQGNEGLAAFAMVDDICWVLQQLCENGNIPQRAKRAHSELEDSGRDKRQIFLHLYHMTSLTFDRLCV